MSRAMTESDDGDGRGRRVEGEGGLEQGTDVGGDSAGAERQLRRACPKPISSDKFVTGRRRLPQTSLPSAFLVTVLVDVNDDVQPLLQNRSDAAVAPAAGRGHGHRR